MMEFADREPIYLQIRTYMADQILAGTWRPGDRVPSVRELAVTMEVNPNTVSRTYLLLQEEGILENRRGIGYFVDITAPARVRADLKTRLDQIELPRIFASLALAGLEPGDLEQRYRTYLESKGITK